MFNLQQSFACLRQTINSPRKLWFRKFSSKNNSSAFEGCINVDMLKNGMRMMCEEKKRARVTTIGCFLPAGSMQELADERGASLFMEHLLFRRTRCKKPEEIEEALQEIGGKLAAVAMRDMFLFYGTASSCEIERIVALLSDVIFNGVITEEDVNREKLIILNDLDQMETDHQRVAMDYLPTIAYQGTELGRSIYPTTLEIQNINEKQINRFKARLFKPSFMTLISTGGTPFEQLQCLGEHYFNKKKECDRDENHEVCNQDDYPPTHYCRFTGCEMRLRNDEEDLGYVAVAVEGPGHKNYQDHCALTVAKELVGAWDLTHGDGRHNAPFLAHRAFGTDMCIMYKSFNLSWACTSLWGCYFVCEKMMLEDMMFMVQNEWMRLCTSVTSKEVSRAVNQCKTKEIINIKDSVDRFFDLATSLHRRGCYESFNERLTRYDNVSCEMLKNVADKYIYDQCPAVVALGRVENLPDYNGIRTYMYQLRR